MNRSIWLIVREGEERIRIEEPAALFVNLAGLIRNEERGTIINNFDQLPAAASEGLACQAAAEPVTVIEPVVHLQNNPAERYMLQHAAINAGLFQYKQLSQKQMELQWQQFRLRTDAELKDERLFLVQCIDLCMLCWQRVNNQLQPLGEAHIVRRDNQGLIVQQEKQELSERTLRALETAAARALYAIWLDIGSVLVAVSGTGTIAIRKAWSLEHGAGKLPLQRTVLNESLYHWLAFWQTGGDHQLQIGADPELLVVDEHNKLVMASELFLDYTHEEIGIDSLLYKKQIIYPIIELRPLPVSEPAQLISSLHRLLKQLHTYIDGRKLRLLAGAMPSLGVALGGHLHLSGVPLTARLLRLLDITLALPFDALADERGRQRSRTFGALGDYRKQFHGGFEYRTLPSWLVSPALTQAAIYTCWLAVQEREKLAERLDALEELKQYTERYEHGAREERCSLALTYIEQLIDVVKDHKLVERLRPLQRALANCSSWDEQRDIRLRWQLIEDNELREVK